MGAPISNVKGEASKENAMTKNPPANTDTRLKAVREIVQADTTLKAIAHASKSEANA
jgi:hypothetical protein